MMSENGQRRGRGASGGALAMAAPSEVLKRLKEQSVARRGKLGLECKQRHVTSSPRGRLPAAAADHAGKRAKSNSECAATRAMTTATPTVNEVRGVKRKATRGGSDADEKPMPSGDVDFAGLFKSMHEKHAKTSKAKAKAKAKAKMNRNDASAAENADLDEDEADLRAGFTREASDLHASSLTTLDYRQMLARNQSLQAAVLEANQRIDAMVKTCFRAKKEVAAIMQRSKKMRDWESDMHKRTTAVMKLNAASDGGERAEATRTAMEEEAAMGSDAEVVALVHALHGASCFSAIDTACGALTFPVPNEDMKKIFRSFWKRRLGAASGSTPSPARARDADADAKHQGRPAAEQEEDYDSDGDEGEVAAGSNGSGQGGSGRGDDGGGGASSSTRCDSASGNNGSCGGGGGDKGVVEWKAYDVQRLHLAVLCEMRAGLALAALRNAGASSSLWDNSLSVSLQRIESMQVHELVNGNSGAEALIDWTGLARRHMRDRLSADECKKRWELVERAKCSPDATSAVKSRRKNRRTSSSSAAAAAAVSVVSTAGARDERHGVRGGDVGAALSGAGDAGGGVGEDGNSGGGGGGGTGGARSGAARGGEKGHARGGKSTASAAPLTASQAHALDAILARRGVLPMDCDAWHAAAREIGAHVSSCVRHEMCRGRGSDEIEKRRSYGKHTADARRHQTRVFQSHRQSMSMNRNLRNGRWSAEELALFTSARAVFGNDYGLVSQSVGSRNYDQCRKRAAEIDAGGKRVLQPVAWTFEMDVKLLETVRRVGRKWTKVSKEMNLDVDVCRHRYDRTFNENEPKRCTSELSAKRAVARGAPVASSTGKGARREGAGAPAAGGEQLRWPAEAKQPRRMRSYRELYKSALVVRS